MQGELRLRRQFRPVLVDVNRAMEATGYALPVVLEMVDTGDLRWVWDVSLAGGIGRRELRFWLGELLAPGHRRSTYYGDVVESIVGREASEYLRRASVADLLLVRRQQVMRLVDAGELDARQDGNPQWVTRSSVVGFLSRRWMGA